MMYYKRSSLVFLFILCYFIGIAQKLTIADIQNICNNKDVDTINQILLAKGWSFYDSKDEKEREYGVVRWAYNKSSSGDKANGWVRILTDNGFSEQCEYTVFNTPAYFIVFNAIKANGYKFLKSSVEENSIVSRYANAKYYLSIHTLKLSDDEYVDNSLTGYKFLIEKKCGMLDNANGSKKIYYEDSDALQIIYNLKDGMFHGAATWYHRNGKVMKTGNFVNDRQNGQFKEYDEEGNLVASYTMLDDSIDGILMIYDNQKLVSKVSYKNGAKQGVCDYYSSNDAGTITILDQGNYINNVRDGVWNTFLLKDGKKLLMDFITFKNGVQDGKFCKYKNDSVIFGSYKNDRIDGEYLVYSNNLIRVFGIYEYQDTINMSLCSKGFYKDGKKTGFWRNYQGRDRVEAGYYVNDLKEGEWKRYYADYLSYDKSLNIKGELYLVEQYQHGKRNGKSERFSYIVPQVVPCEDLKSPINTNSDTCYKYYVERFKEVSTYKDDLLDGPYLYTDSHGIILSKGNYRNGKKEGEWLESEKYYVTDSSISYYFKKGTYKNGLKHGLWIKSLENGNIADSTNYYEGMLNGLSITYGEGNIKKSRLSFLSGKLTKLEVFDDKGDQVIRIYDIVDETSSFYRLKRTLINPDNTSVGEYYWAKDNQVTSYDLFDIVFSISSINEDGNSCYPDGMFVGYDSKMQKIYEGRKYKAMKIGDWIYYYPDQDVEVKIGYGKDGEIKSERYVTMSSQEDFSGTFKYIDSKANTREECKIKKGLRNGKSVLYDMTSGDKIKVVRYSEGKVEE